MNNPTTPSANLDQEPFYLPVGDEVALFKAAYAQRLPVLLKGPTGCGKTRFVEYMAYQLFRGRRRLPNCAVSNIRYKPLPVMRICPPLTS